MKKSVLAASILVSAVLLSSSLALGKPRAQQKPPEIPSGVLTLPHVIAGGMVLQRDVELPIWGWAAPGAKVAVKLGGNEKSATAAADGKWRVKMPAMKAGGPHKMTVTADAMMNRLPDTLTLDDILVGEVWLCSGQSNMAWGLANSANGPKAVAEADHPKIRLFQVPNVQAAEPARDVNATWQHCTPQTAGGFSAVGYYFGREIHKALNVPVGVINASWGGSPIQPWTPPAGYEQVKLLAAEKPAPGMYNGMVAPVVPFAIRGALWYQGESNVGDHPRYCDRMKALILGWRSVWGQGELPFYYVQLAPYKNYAAILPYQWEAQTEALSVPNTGMAVITDLVDNLGDIHPRNKLDVGKRLSLIALAKTYGKKDVVYSGPMYKTMNVRDGKIVVTFDHVGGGLASRDGKELTWFTIAGKDKNFVPAKAVIDGDKVIVSGDGVAEPEAVRFAWNGIAQPNLINKEGLPAGAFRTDRW